ncbi:MAG: NAD-dependent epimerase/dehydratase family protein [Planctomycetota bacterium]
MAEARVDWNALHGSAFAGKRCLVTGGLGFIGGHLTEALAGLGATVVILDNASGGNRWPYCSGDVCVHEDDIVDPYACEIAADQCDVAFHLAAKVSVPASVNDPIAYHTADASGTLNVLDACKRMGVSRVVYSASSSAYGDSQTLPKVESMPSMPMSPYAAAKLAGEGYCRAYAACYEIDVVSLRYFNVFGPRQNANSAYAGVIAAFARDLVAGKRPTIFGDGSASRDFTHVDNVVHANLLAARHATRLGGDVFNVGTGQRVTVSELARKMASVLDRDDLEPRFQPPRTGDVPHSQAGLDKPTAVLGYEPIVSFERGLKETVAWYRAQAAA